MNISISLVWLGLSVPVSGKSPTFCGAAPALMVDPTQHMGLTSVRINGVAQRLGVDGETLVGVCSAFRIGNAWSRACRSTRMSGSRNWLREGTE